MQRIHLIAIGGAIMHNIAIALHKKGYNISGSDDLIFDPSKSRLKKYGLLPQKTGWYAEKITRKIDAVILGMHARKDNLELQKAQCLGIKIYSFPEFIYEQTKNKIRIVIGGSHGKTTITSMIMHVLRENNILFDYLSGAQMKGFNTMVGLSENTKMAVLEGDEYLSSVLDRRPKFHLYRPHIALLSGIEWDHINVFPAFKNYVCQFDVFINQYMEDGGTLYYFDKDVHLQKIIKKSTKNITCIPYGTHKHFIMETKSILQTAHGHFPLQIFGKHNMQNLNGARLICSQLGVSTVNFYRSISSFSGADRRMQILATNENSTVFHDFAHSPSKLKATVKAVKEQFPNRKLVACMELHTFSSLKKNFLPQYKDTMSKADEAHIFFNPQTIKHKHLECITAKEIKHYFGTKNICVFTDVDRLFARLKKTNKQLTNYLFMSSGDFDGKDLSKIAKVLIL